LLPIRDVEQLLARAADWARRVFNVPRVMIYLQDSATGHYLHGLSVDAAEHSWQEQERVMPTPGGLTETIIATHESVLVRDTREHPSVSSRRLAELGLLSRMGVPLRVGEDVLGALLVAGTAVNQFSERELNMLEFMATQISSAIQNALQFGRTEAALSVVRRQARYQANVSQAAALLTERGTEAVFDVLRLLGEASAAQGVLYLEYHAAEDNVAMEDAVGTVAGDSYWQSRAMWMATTLPTDGVDTALLDHLSLERMQPWADQLIGKPYLTLQPEALPDSERELMQALGFNTLLVLTVRGEALYPNVILIGRADAEGAWVEDEIVAMQTAAATLSNTIARERVFQEVQTSRTETEALYRGSAELNLAQSYDGILNVLRTHTVLGQGAYHMTLQLFDHPWTDESEPQYAEVVAHWTTTDRSMLRERVWLDDFPAAQEWGRHPGMIVLDDVENNPLLSRKNRALFSRVFGAKTVILVPLVASGQRIGFVHAMYPQSMAFSEQERRRLESLTQQAAIATQNRLQLLTIEARVNRERMIREITERIQAAPDVQGVLQAAVRELGRAFGTPRNRIQFRSPGESTGTGTDGDEENERE